VCTERHCKQISTAVLLLSLCISRKAVRNYTSGENSLVSEPGKNAEQGLNAAVH